MTTYLMIYLKWVMISPVFTNSGALWRNEQHSRMKEILKHSGLIPIVIQSNGSCTEMLYAIPASNKKKEFHKGISTDNKQEHKRLLQYNFNWQIGSGFRIKNIGNRGSGLSVGHFQADPLIGGFLQYVSRFNQSFDEDLFLDLSIRKISL